MFAILLSIVVVLTKDAPDWKAVIKDREFQFHKAETAAINSVSLAIKAGYFVEFNPGPEPQCHGDYTFSREKGPQISLRDRFHYAFAFRGDVLFYANYSRHATGCAIVEYDLKTGKEVRENPLLGIGPITHMKYRNRVAMSIEQHPTVKDAYALVVTGWETSGGYIEIIDLTTGKQLAHKKFEQKEVGSPHAEQ